MRTIALRFLWLSALFLLTSCTVSYRAAPGANEQLATVDCSGTGFLSGNAAAIIAVDGKDVESHSFLLPDPAVVYVPTGTHTVTLLVAVKTEMYPVGFYKGAAVNYATSTTYKKFPITVTVSAGEYYRCYRENRSTGYLWQTEPKYYLRLDRQEMADRSLGALRESMKSN